MSIGTVLGLYLMDVTNWWVIVFIISLFVPASYVIGYMHWNAAERQYQIAVDEGLTNSQS